MSALDSRSQGTVAPSPGPPTRQRSLVRTLGFNRFGGVYAWAVLIAVFGAWVPQTFLATSTFQSIAASQSVTAIAALAVVPTLAAGLFDLSVAATLGLAAVLPLYLQLHGWSVTASILVSLVSGVGIGALNGFLVVIVGIDSFIATLATSSILAAWAYWTTNGNQLVAPAGSSFVKLGQNSFLGVPVPLLYAVVIGAVLLYMMEWTTFGSYLRAIGGNSDAARLVGIRVDRIKFGALLITGFLGAAAGVVLSAQLGAASSAIGPPYLLPAFSATLLGATQIKTNGRPNVLGTMLAVFLLATGIYGLQLVGAPSFVSDLFNGLALIVAVTLSLQARRRSATG
jgi:ribose transport system permease protein